MALSTRWRRSVPAAQRGIGHRPADIGSARRRRAELSPARRAARSRAGAGCRAGRDNTCRTIRGRRSAPGAAAHRADRGVSSKTITTPEPSGSPAARRSSKVRRTSSWSACGKGAGRAAKQDGLQRMPVAHAARQVVEQVAQGDAKRHFVQARAAHIARDAEQLGPGRFFRAELAVSGRPVVRIIRDIAQGLDVVDDGRLAEQAVRGGEGRLDAREAALAFDRLRTGRSPRRKYKPRRPGAARRQSQTRYPGYCCPMYPAWRASSSARSNTW